MNKIKHIIVSRLWFEDKALMDKYLTVAKDVLVPCLEAQTCQDFEFGIIVKSEDVEYVKQVLGIEFTPFNGMADFNAYALKGKYNIQTRQDIDDWVSDDYVEKIQETYKKKYSSFQRMVVHAHPVRAEYPGWKESEMREYTGKHTSMFLSLCQKEVKHTVFEKQHGMMYSLADTVIKLPKGYAKWVQHSNSVSSTRDKVRGEKILSGPDNALHMWVRKPPKPAEDVTVKYINGKVKTHPRRYALELQRRGIASIIDIPSKKGKPVFFTNNRGKIDYDKKYRIGVVVVCYETPDLIYRAVNSVVSVDGVRVMIVDNSSPDSDCWKACDKLALNENVEVVHTGANIFHGPGLHKGIGSLSTEYICVMDSDAEVVDVSVLDKMIKVLRDDEIYAVGLKVSHFSKGNKYYSGHEFDYLKPWFAMFKIDNYYKFSPFIHHGAPWCQALMDIAGIKRVVAIDNPEKYVKHKNHGTYNAAKNSWLSGWEKPVVNKFLKILMICTVYNEIKYLPHVINFWKNQGVDVYVIDNMSDDGTWEWLQKNNIPSHQFDTKGMFHLDKLQEEMIRVLHDKKPDWFIYGAADMYFGFDAPVKKIIYSCDIAGYNQVTVDLLNFYNTGEDHKLPLMENYFSCGTVKTRTYISKYASSIKFLADTIIIPNRKITHVKGAILNYGACKTPGEQDMKLQRRQRAWKNGLSKSYGSHYLSGKKNQWTWIKDNMIDIRDMAHYKYYSNILRSCETQKASAQAYMGKSAEKIGITAMAWGRHKLFEIWVDHINRLGIPTIVAGSEDEIKRLCKGCVSFVYVDNQPLGRKANLSLMAMKDMNIDYFLRIATDDFICDDFINVYKNIIKDGVDFIGMLDCYHYDLVNDKYGYFQGYTTQRKGEPMGLGRCFSRNLLDQLNWKLWDPSKNKALDISSTKIMKDHSFKTAKIRLRDHNIYAIDIKDGKNINPFHVINTEECEAPPIIELNRIRDEKYVICPGAQG